MKSQEVIFQTSQKLLTSRARSSSRTKASGGNIIRHRPYAYDVTEGRPRALGSNEALPRALSPSMQPTPACHTAGLARACALTERQSALHSIRSIEIE